MYIVQYDSIPCSMSAACSKAAFLRVMSIVVDLRM